MSRPVVVALGPRLRPEFVIHATRSPERIIEDFRAALKRPDATVTGKIRGEVMQLNIPKAEQNLGSPCMELSVERADPGSTLYVRIGPLPQVWTTFMFLHLMIAMCGLGGIIWGLAHLFMGGELWPFWIPLGALFLNAFVAGAAFIGQALCADQIYRLRTFLSDGSARDRRRGPRVDRAAPRACSGRGAAGGIGAARPVRYNRSLELKTIAGARRRHAESRSSIVDAGAAGAAGARLRRRLLDGAFPRRARIDGARGADRPERRLLAGVRLALH